MAEEFNLSVENEVYDISFNEETSEIIVDIQDNVTAINVDFHQGYYPLPNEGSGSSDWNDITNKPSTFPPSAHTHTISEVINLQSTLDNKLDKDGNAATATALQTARTLTIGNTGKSFDGSGNVSWSLAEIGAQSILTNPITGTGTTNYIPKFSASGTLANSIVYDNGTSVGIGTGSPSEKLDVNGNVKATLIKDQYGTLRSQRVITVTGNITLSQTHNGAILHITNTCNITIPTGLGADFACDCYVKGAFIATFVNGGVTLNSPSGLLLKTDKMATLYSNASDVFNLLGELATS